MSALACPCCGYSSELLSISCPQCGAATVLAPREATIGVDRIVLNGEFTWRDLAARLPQFVQWGPVQADDYNRLRDEFREHMASTVDDEDDHEPWRYGRPADFA